MKSTIGSILLCLGLSVPAFAVIWSEPVLLEELNDPAIGQNAAFPHLSVDGLTLYFARKGVNGIPRLWEAYRDDQGELLLPRDKSVNCSMEDPYGIPGFQTMD